MSGVLELASRSPRRQALLKAAGIEFRVVVPDVEELSPESGDPHEVARENARRKAAAVLDRPAAGERGAVLAADTVVAVGERLLGKPRDAGHQKELLRALSGTTHRVVTGLALAAAGRLFVSSVETEVTMRTLTPDEIDDYVASGEGMGKAGGYAIQESADRFVSGLKGPYDNVVGLPVAEVSALMRRAGL